ncbi:MAG: flavodoxin domain-containing protein [Anaerolineae bacterium]
MIKVLIIYATHSGSTTEVVEFMQNSIQEASIQVDVVQVQAFDGDMSAYDALILGSPIHRGVWLLPMWRMLRKQARTFGQKPVWAFSMCLRILEEDGYQHAQRHYFQGDLLTQLNLQDHQFFSGSLSHTSAIDKSDFLQRYDGASVLRDGDYRDWDAIRHWTLMIAQSLRETSSNSSVRGG